MQIRPNCFLLRLVIGKIHSWGLAAYNEKFKLVDRANSFPFMVSVYLKQREQYINVDLRT